MKRQTLLQSLLLTGFISVLLATPAKAKVLQVRGSEIPHSLTASVILEMTDGAAPQVCTV